MGRGERQSSATAPLPGQAAGWVGRFSFAAALCALAADILPRSDLIVGTGMAPVNRTLEGMLALCSPGSEVALVGPSVPLGEGPFDYGISLLCGRCVEQPQRVMDGVRQGANFHQIHP